MKRILLLVILFSIWTVPAKAWNCSDPLASRVDIGTTKPSGGSGSGDGQYFLGTGSEGTKGHYYVCEVPKPKTPGKPKANPVTNTNTNQNANNNNNSNANSNTNSNKSTSTSSATGGNATQGQQQGQSQSANNTQSQSASASNNGNGNGNGANNSSYQSTTNYDAAKIPVNTAYAPTTVPTVDCYKTYSGGAQTAPFGISIGGGKIDKTCRDLNVALHAPNQIVYCKLYVKLPEVAKAGVTLQDCLGTLPASPVTEQVKQEPVVVAAPVPVATFHTESVDHTVDGGDCTLYRGRVGNVCTQVLNSDKLKLEANQDAVITVRAASLPEAQAVTRYLIANDIPASRISDPTITGKNPGYVGFSVRWTSTVSVQD